MKIILDWKSSNRAEEKTGLQSGFLALVQLLLCAATWLNLPCKRHLNLYGYEAIFFLDWVNKILSVSK